MRIYNTWALKNRNKSSMTSIQGGVFVIRLNGEESFWITLVSDQVDVSLGWVSEGSTSWNNWSFPRAAVSPVILPSVWNPCPLGTRTHAQCRAHSGLQQTHSTCLCCGVLNLIQWCKEKENITHREEKRFFMVSSGFNRRLIHAGDLNSDLELVGWKNCRSNGLCRKELLVLRGPTVVPAITGSLVHRSDFPGLGGADEELGVHQ